MEGEALLVRAALLSPLPFYRTYQACSMSCTIAHINGLRDDGTEPIWIHHTTPMAVNLLPPTKSPPSTQPPF
jgi:hypothetical protein